MPTSYQQAAERPARTQRFWQEWLEHGTFLDHPWRTHLQQSALTLEGLTYAPSGAPVRRTQADTAPPAMIAASTTSLPEAPGGERNRAYRRAEQQLVLGAPARDPELAGR